MFPDFDEIEFDIDTSGVGGSTGEAFSTRPAYRPPVEPVSDEHTDDSISPVFRILSRPALPALKHETRARLMMQSPTRLYFYWAVGKHALQALRKVAGIRADDYRLAVRLLDLTNEAEELHAVDAEGSWWFDVGPDREYRAEIGFYSASRPFVRILFSNTISTPRKGPSPHSSAEARWAVTTHEFAEVLDVSGFEEDAFEVFVGTPHVREAFARRVGLTADEEMALNEVELLRALGHLGADLPLEDLRFRITPELFALLQSRLERLSAAAVRDLGVLRYAEFEGLTAIGGSLVNIPRRRSAPISSMNVP